jgi:Type III restriction enzyme, res subunit
VRLLHRPEPGLKFDKIYELYRQRFHRDDFDENEKFDPKVLPNSYLTNPQPGHAFVYVSTIQRMTINLFGRNAIFAARDEEADDDAPTLDIPINAFDLIIADECHRGYTTAEIATWRKTLNHFDTVKIGLTATPAAHSMGMFKEITYRYEYERAVQEGYLGANVRKWVLLPEQAQAYLDACTEPLRTVAIVVLDAGLRPDECFRLRWENVRFVDAQRAVLVVPGTKSAACAAGAHDAASSCYI